MQVNADCKRGKKGEEKGKEEWKDTYGKPEVRAVFSENECIGMET